MKVVAIVLAALLLTGCNEEAERRREAHYQCGKIGAEWILVFTKLAICRKPDGSLWAMDLPE